MNYSLSDLIMKLKCDYHIAKCSSIHTAMRWDYFTRAEHVIPDRVDFREHLMLNCLQTF